MRGINLIMLISRANHVNNQFDLVTASKDLITIEVNIRDENGNTDNIKM